MAAVPSHTSRQAILLQQGEGGGRGVGGQGDRSLGRREGALSRGLLCAHGSQACGLSGTFPTLGVQAVWMQTQPPPTVPINLSSMAGRGAADEALAAKGGVTSRAHTRYRNTTSSLLLCCWWWLCPHICSELQRAVCCCTPNCALLLQEPVPVQHHPNDGLAMMMAYLSSL